MQEVFICDGVRTPIGRYGGSLSSIRTDDLAAISLAALLKRNPSLAPEIIEEVILGCANQAGEDNRNVARMASLLAGLPQTVPAATINRLCGSGMDAIGTIARAIRAGEIAIGIGGGVESMSRAPFVMPKADSAFSRSNAVYDTTIGWRFINPKMKVAYGVDQMPETAEHVASDLAISREDQDAFALRSQQRCAAAQEAGFFDAEIQPVELPSKKGAPTLFAKDEHPRADTSVESLAKLKPVVKADGSVTAGNASGINDGGAAVVLASDKAVEERGLHSLYIPEHTHIPTSRRSPWPGGPELPREYKRTNDLFVSLAMAAASICRKTATALAAPASSGLRSVAPCMALGETRPKARVRRFGFTTRAAMFAVMPEVVQASATPISTRTKPSTVKFPGRNSGSI